MKSLCRYLPSLKGTQGTTDTLQGIGRNPGRTVRMPDLPTHSSPSGATITAMARAFTQRPLALMLGIRMEMSRWTWWTRIMVMGYRRHRKALRFPGGELL